MGSWFVKPEVRTLTLTDGHTLTVRRQLNAGEQRARYDRMSNAGVDGELRVNRLQVGLATITAYLVDWNLTENGEDVPIRGLSPAELTAVLDNLDIDRFSEILLSISAHEAAVTAERSAEKNGQGIGSASPAISELPSAAVGESSGCVS